MNIFKFAWILSTAYFGYYLIVYLLELSKVRRATSPENQGHSEYKVDGGEHRPVTMAGRDGDNPRDGIEDNGQPDDEKKK